MKVKREIKTTESVLEQFLLKKATPRTDKVCQNLDYPGYKQIQETQPKRFDQIAGLEKTAFVSNVSKSMTSDALRFGFFVKRTIVNRVQVPTDFRMQLIPAILTFFSQKDCFGVTPRSLLFFEENCHCFFALCVFRQSTRNLVPSKTIQPDQTSTAFPKLVD
ncbi:MAG: hypothetical protein ACRC10_07380 [Thermoguttaceae bacterium]